MELKERLDTTSRSTLVLEKNFHLTKYQLSENLTEATSELEKSIEFLKKMTLDNNQIISENQMKFHYVTCEFQATQMKFEQTKKFMLKTMPTLTYLQISDALQEFLCIGDQVKLIDVDRSRMLALHNNTFTPEQLGQYIEKIQYQTLNLNQGCGKFKIGQAFDEEYLAHRAEVLDRYGKAHHKLQQLNDTKNS